MHFPKNMHFTKKLTLALQDAELETFCLKQGDVRIAAKVIEFNHSGKNLKLTFFAKSVFWSYENCIQSIGDDVFKTKFGVCGLYRHYAPIHWRDTSCDDNLPPLWMCDDHEIAYRLTKNRFKDWKSIYPQCKPHDYFLKKELQVIWDAAIFDNSELELAQSRHQHQPKFQLTVINRPDWKDLKFPGTYRIWNTVTNHQYIGTTGNIYKRWGKHRWKLTKNRHDSKLLQMVWNKFGEQSFRWVVQEQLPAAMPEAQRKRREYFWQLVYESEYNEQGQFHRECLFPALVL